MTIDKPENPTHQRGQPLSLLSFSTGDSVLPVLGTLKSRRDPKEQLAFLQSILEQALEIANDVDDWLLEGDLSLDNNDGDSCVLSQKQ
jgi:hypothetical protein